RFHPPGDRTRAQAAAAHQEKELRNSRMMPWQLKVGLYNKRKSGRTEQRPLAELLPHINVSDLQIPRDYQTYIADVSLRYPHISSMKINYSMVQFHHSNRVQTFRFKWIKTGLGYPRATFICECGRPVIKIYYRHQNLACRRCSNAIHGSQTRNKRGRQILKAVRLRNFLELKSGMSKRDGQRLKARIPSVSTQELKGKRLAHHRIAIPFSNYGTRGAMHWL